MKNVLLVCVALLSGLLLSSCIKQTNTRTAMETLLKATTGIRKDIGTAD